MEGRDSECTEDEGDACEVLGRVKKRRVEGVVGFLGVGAETAGEVGAVGGCEVLECEVVEGEGELESERVPDWLWGWHDCLVGGYRRGVSCGGCYLVSL